MSDSTPPRFARAPNDECVTFATKLEADQARADAEQLLQYSLGGIGGAAGLRATCPESRPEDREKAQALLPTYARAREPQAGRD